MIRDPQIWHRAKLGVGTTERNSGKIVAAVHTLGKTTTILNKKVYF
jgi:hypothetical protein